MYSLGGMAACGQWMAPRSWASSDALSRAGSFGKVTSYQSAMDGETLLTQANMSKPCERACGVHMLRWCG
jgi:hypothetical protein